MIEDLQEELDDAQQQASCSVCGEYGCECPDEGDPFAEDQSPCSCCGDYRCGNGPAAVWADCAECGKALADANGSQLLTLDEFPVGGIACTHCGQLNSLPKKFIGTGT